MTARSPATLSTWVLLIDTAACLRQGFPAERSPGGMLSYLCGREDLPAEPIENCCCYRRYRTVVVDRPIFDALAHAPGQPFACNLKIAIPAAGRVVLQTVIDLLADTARRTTCSGIPAAASSSPTSSRSRTAPAKTK